LEYGKRRVAFDLEVQAARAETEPEVVPSLSKAGKEGRKPGDTAQGQPPSPAESEKALLSKDEYGRLLAIQGQIDPGDRYIGRSVPILRVFEQIADFNKRPDEPVLILGPTGAGKTEIAEIIHRSSNRHECEFVQVQATDVMASDESLIRAEWLGYGPNSGISGSDPKGRPGLLTEAEGGTVFVDEMDLLPPWFQKFLFPVFPVSNPTQMRPLGGGTPFIPNVRLVFATNKPLAEVRNTLLHDFLRRLGNNELRIPPLSERLEDVLLFAESECGERKRSPGFLLCLVKYSWPGNVGELLQVLAKAVSRTSSPEEELTIDQLELPDPRIVEEVKRMPKDEQEQDLLQSLGGTLRQPGVEKGQRGAGLQQRMAEFLGCSPSTITRMSKL
jgi:psp operon transcriptional activator